MKPVTSTPCKMPPTFRAGGLTWTLLLVPFHRATSPRDKGLTEWEEATISIADCDNSAIQRRTLLHELIHVAELQGGLEDDEHRTCALERNLWAIFADNPALVRYLFQ